MFDNADVAFSEHLERVIRGTLWGDNESIGLYRGLRNCQSWDAFNHAKGVIEGYEQVLGRMLQIRQHMNGEGVRQQPRVN